jgi:predicted Zn-dependent protease
LAFGQGERERALERADVALELMESELEPSLHGAALASIFRALFDLVGAERALTVSEASEARDQIGAWVKGTRTRLDALGISAERKDPELRRFVRVYLDSEEQCSVGAYPEGLRILRSVPKAQRDHPALLQLECAALLRTGRSKDARVVCQRGLVRHPDHPNLSLEMARVEAAEGRLGRAVKILERAVTFAPEGHEVFPLLIALYRAMNRPQSVDALHELHQRRFGHPIP